MDCAVVVFAKPPGSGVAKTRLAEDIGRKQADAFAHAFLADTLERLCRWGRCSVWLAGAGTPAEFREYCGSEVTFVSQVEGHLGERMLAVRKTLQERGQGMVALGADTPHLEGAYLDSAVAAVSSNELVLGPAVDGGYYLLGVPCDSRADAALFGEHPWGTSDVLASTRRLLDQNSLRWQELPTFWDIDHLSDLVQWKEWQRAADSSPRGDESALDRALPWRSLALLESLPE